MDRSNLLTAIVVFFVLYICIKIYTESDTFNLRCIISDVDGNEYCVRERSKIKLAAGLLAEATGRCSKLVSHLHDKYPNKDVTKRLVDGFNPKRVREILPTSSYTAYSENKGETLAFCLNTTKTGNKLIDINTLTFVALHELSHIATKSVGHTQEYWQNFKYILTQAVEIGIYEPIDYKKNPQKYCSMTISDNPYYDL
tara:strand:- start:870 stop:1463 length:594 start_codon:yes stop_codon:yes gene_type:complete